MSEQDKQEQQQQQGQPQSNKDQQSDHSAGAQNRVEMPSNSQPKDDDRPEDKIIGDGGSQLVQT